MPLRSLPRRLEQSFLGRCVSSFVEQRGLDRSMVIASQAFTALIPLLILVSTVVPTNSENEFADAIIERFNLVGEAAASVQLVFTTSEPGSVGIGSLLLLVFSGVSLTRRLQRMYVQMYGLPSLPSVRGSINAALGLGVLLVEVALLYLVRTLLRNLPFDWLVGLPLTIVTGLVLWTSIPYLLLDRRLPWQRLMPVGALTAVAVSLYGWATGIYMPRLMTSYTERYGLFGITIAIVGWLICTSFIVVAATTVAAELDRAPDPWARKLRARLDARADARARADADADDARPEPSGRMHGPGELDV